MGDGGGDYGECGQPRQARKNPGFAGQAKLMIKVDAVNQILEPATQS